MAIRLPRLVAGGLRGVLSEPGGSLAAMARWVEVPDELSSAVWAALAAHKHKVLATLRADGSPRVSGTEVELLDGDLWIGSMPGALKARDLLRDPRFALHSAPVDATLAVPDVKIAGTAEAAGPAQVEAFVRHQGSAPGSDPGEFHLFRLDVTEVVSTTVADDQLVVTSWHPGRGVQVRRR